MRLGFTGTREGLSGAQIDSLRQWFSDRPYLIDSLWHGCCVGADEWVVTILSELKRKLPSKFETTIFALPCTYLNLVSKVAWTQSCEVRFPEEPLKRNREIVDACDHLLACPKGPEEQRSGTWSTVRYARKQKKPITVIWPDGTLTEENQ